MVSIIQQSPGLGELLGMGASQGLIKGMQHSLTQDASRRKTLGESYGKLRGSAAKDVNTFLKNYQGALADNEKAKNQIYKNYLELIDQAEAQGMPIDPNLALDMAISSFQKGTGQEGDQVANMGLGGVDLSNPFMKEVLQKAYEQSDVPGEPMAKFMGLLQGLGGVAEKVTGGSIQSRVDRALREAAGEPEPQLIPNATPRQLEKQAYGKDIGEFLGESAITAAIPLERALGPAFKFIKDSKVGKIISNMLKPAETAAAKQAAPSLAKGAEKVSEAFQSVPMKPKVAEAIPKAIEKPTSFSEKGKATALRTERAAPEARLFKTEKELQLREKQLKNFPKYESEIAKDAEERALKLAKKTEKGPQAQLTQAAKMAKAEAEIPSVRSAYEKASARVRAIENEMVKPNIDTVAIKPLLSAAKQELQEAEYMLRQTINNAKTGEARIGFDKMKDAAQKKVLDIQSKVAEGEAVKLAKKDYNPEFIKEAKELGKRKPLEAKRQSDYFTQVHDGYGQVYKDRIAQIDKEMTSTQKGLGGLLKRQQLQEEKNILKNLVDHVEAENTIHRHKMALRETAERKKASERLSKMTKGFKGSEKSTTVANQKLKEGVKLKPSEEGKKAASGTAKETKQTVEETVKETAKKAGAKGSEILKEKEAISKAAEASKNKAKEAGRGLNEALDQTSKEGAKKAANVLIKQWRETIDSLTGAGPSFFKTQTGKDFLFGFGLDTVENVYYEATGQSLPTQLKVAFKAPIMIASGTAIRLSPSKGIATFLSDRIWESWRKRRVKSALSEGRSQDYADLKKKYGTTYVNKIAKEFNQ